jgi:HlyD family secretion protein
MTWTKRIFAVLFVLGIAGIVVLSLRPKPEKPVEVQTSLAHKSSITRRVTAPGKLQPATQVKVSSNLSGDLLELAVEEGAHVTKGQFLARIDSRRYGAQVKQQEALRAASEAEQSLQQIELARLQSERDRVKKLVETSSASPAELQQAESQVAAQEARVRGVIERVAQASAALSEASHMLSMTTLYAPIDGTVTSKLKQVGERVRGSDFSEDVLLVISTLSAMEVKVEVGEHEVVYLKVGDKADIEIDAFPDKRFPASVVEVAQNATIKNPGTEQEVTTFPVRLTLEGSVPSALPGMSAEAAISTETHPDALVVPIQAVAARADKDLPAAKAKGGEGAVIENQVPKIEGARKPARGMQKVVFVMEDGKARARRVETGLASETEIEILDGLKDGETIIEGPYRAVSRELNDGKPVKLEEKKKDEGKRS